MIHEQRDAKNIFLAAIEKYSPNQWSVYLDGACANEPELRERVEVLLEAHSGKDSFLDQSPATMDQPPCVARKAASSRRRFIIRSTPYAATSNGTRPIEKNR